MKVLPILLLGLALPVCAQTVYRCAGPDGRAVFQQAACADGEKVKVRQTNSAESVKPPAPHPVTQEATQAAAIKPMERGPLAAIADRCLDWYRPRLRDPRGAYYSEASQEKRVLTLTIHATNGFGGYVTKRAACEVVRGEIDSSWTAKHAEGYGWR